jgi:hypothetical protein
MSVTKGHLLISVLPKLHTQTRRQHIDKYTYTTMNHTIPQPLSTQCCTIVRTDPMPTHPQRLHGIYAMGVSAHKSYAIHSNT